MITDLTVVEQRHRAVIEVLEHGARITDIALRFGVDRKTLYRWISRYEGGGLAALVDKSKRPNHCPHQMSEEIEERIIELRRAHPDFGPRTILNRLRREMEDPPSRSAIHRCLVRNRLIDHKPRKRRRQDYKSWERTRPMELWQIDVMTAHHLVEGSKLQIVTGIDDHSRFCVIANLVQRATARPICDALMQALETYGIPEEILTDNGRVFTGRLQKMPTNVLFDRICVNNGIKHILTTPYSPTTIGKIERLHRTIRKEFLAKANFENIDEAQAALDRWVHSYNHDREHQSLGDRPPIRRFELALNEPQEVIDGEVAIEQEQEPANPVVGRTVDTFGRVSIFKHRYTLGRHYAGETVSVESTDGQLHFTHNGVLIATHQRRHTIEQDERLRRKKKSPSRPTKGTEVIRKVDSSGNVSFAATNYRVGQAYVGENVGVRLVADEVQIIRDGKVHRTHKARHDRSREFGSLAFPNGKPRRSQSAA